MSNNYHSPARPIALYRDPFPDSWLFASFAVLATAFVWIVFVMGW